MVQDDLEMLWILTETAEIAETNWIYYQHQLGKLKVDIMAYDILHMENPPARCGDFPASQPMSPGDTIDENGTLIGEILPHEFSQLRELADQWIKILWENIVALPCFF